MTVGVEVKGLKQALDNMQQLGSDIPLELGRKALREAGIVISGAVKQATYSTFTRRTGQIKEHFGVRVAQALKGSVLNSVVVQYPAAGGGPLLKAAQRRSVAFWWRFLEFGTSGRRTSTTPKFHRLGRIARGQRQEKALATYSAARSLGDLAARPWVRPAFSASAQTAVERFRDVLLKGIENETTSLPK